MGSSYNTPAEDAENRRYTPKDFYTLINHYTEPKGIWDNVKMILEVIEKHQDGPMYRRALNLSFVNNMLPEWSRFITEVKLNRGLKESNFDQLYAYLKQHEHSTDNLIESLTNTLALLRTSSNARNKATVQDDRVVVQDVRDRYNVNNQGRPFQRNNAKRNVSSGFRLLSKIKMLVMNVMRNGAVLDVEQVLFLEETVLNFEKTVE
ncbi:hypothetical protein Tco_0802436 [Tanacetum coccineum]|uniref:Gag protein n=1 Tax=Tanacetum coccineum TaxID=301880 RepID=A0ABQ5A328_9ASTR